MREESYSEWDKTLGDSRKDIQESWMTWDKSQLNIMYDPRYRPGSGPSGSAILANRDIVESF